MERWH